MPITLGQNLLALPVARYLNRSSDSLATSFERLSSGLRINRAVDDAAGLSVSSQLNAKNRILNRAALNVNDGVSAIEIASGTLQQVSTLLTRMGELAEQSASGSFSSTQRKSLNQEYQALDKELRRLADTTTFNNLALFGGSRSSRAQTVVDAVAGGTAGLDTTTADGRYAFIFDTVLKRKDLITGETTTLTSTTFDGITGIDTTTDGSTTVFSGSIGGVSRAYMWNVSTNTLTQLSNEATDAADLRVGISDDGSTVAFGTHAILSATGSSSGATAAYSIYRYDVATRNFTTQWNQGFDEIYHIDLNADGSYGGIYGLESGGSRGKVARFGSNGDQNSLLYRRGDSPDYAIHMRVLGDGSMYFSSENTLYNIDGGQVFSNDTGGIYYASSSGSVKQIYDSAVNPFIWSASVDGSYLSFMTNIDPTTHAYSTKPQLYRYDALSGATTQISNFTELFDPMQGKLSADGNTYLYRDPETSYLVSKDVSPNAFALNIETGSGAVGVIQANIGSVSGSLRGLGNHVLTTQKSSLGALDNVNKNIERLGQLQGILGSSLSRLSVANKVTQAVAGEVANARARITDTDVATESANLIRHQIIQQAAASLLGQANIIPELALNLIQVK